MGLIPTCWIGRASCCLQPKNPFFNSRFLKKRKKIKTVKIMKKLLNARHPLDIMPEWYCTTTAVAKCFHNEAVVASVAAWRKISLGKNPPFTPNPRLAFIEFFFLNKRT